MRSKSAVIGGFQVYAVAGTNSVSFGVDASSTARTSLLGFGVQRIDSPKGKPHYLLGYKVFPSTEPNPDASTSVSTKSQPVQSLVWDDFTCKPGHTYTYVFHPLRGTPAKLDRSATPVPITITTEPLYGQTTTSSSTAVSPPARSMRSSSATCHRMTNQQRQRRPRHTRGWAVISRRRW